MKYQCVVRQQHQMTEEPVFTGEKSCCHSKDEGQTHYRFVAGEAYGSQSSLRGQDFWDTMWQDFWDIV